MPRDIIIYGGNSVLAKNLTESSTFSLDNKISISRKRNHTNDILFNTSEILNSSNLDKVCLKISELSKFKEKAFILFSWSGRPRNLNKDIDHWKLNKNILFNFLNITNVIKPKKIIFISSAGSVYPQVLNKKFNELDTTYASNDYGEQKLKGELIINEYVKEKGIECAILRVASAYGYDKRFSDQGVINKWLYGSINNQTLKIYNSKDSLINFISFNQISDSIKVAIKNEINGTYNIGCRESTSLEQILFEIEKTINKKINYEIESNKIRNINLDVGKFYKDTGILYNNEIKENIKLIYKSIINNDI